MMASKKSAAAESPGLETHPSANLIDNNLHPDYLAATLSDDNATLSGYTPVPDGPVLPYPSLPTPIPIPIPTPIPGPIIPLPPLRICAAVSGKYSYSSASTPLNLLSVLVRVDVDRFYPQQRISIEVSRLFPRATTHIIAKVSSDQCLGYNQRRIEAAVTYRDGSAALLPGTQLVFEASRSGGSLTYNNYKLTISGGGATYSYKLQFQSIYFDSVDFEVDRVANAGSVVTTFDTTSHANKPADLAAETISLASVYQRAGFDVSMSPHTSVIPIADTGANGTWSDSEMHNAMQTYWQKFANKPQWSMWVLYAARHDSGRGLGGVMFDDIGGNHRQGTAIFTDSFIQDAPAGDAQAAAWRQRMVFWTAVHEMGHAFNLAHAWQKALGVVQGAPGDPWIPLANEPEARSFMNYPFRVSGGQSSFFANFRFRFSDDELIFMRHAPRRFVQMGNSNWFENHGFEAPDLIRPGSAWQLSIRPNRLQNSYSFLEPVVMELKLQNVGQQAVAIDEHLLQDGQHVSILIQREGGDARLWRPMISRCHQEHTAALPAGAAIYGAHTISTTTSGWLIDQPGFYKVQAALDLGHEVVVSNVLRLYVAMSGSAEENRLAADYFTEDVARVLAFGGAPALPTATDTLQELVARCPKTVAALHAKVALATPQLHDYKVLEQNSGQEGLVIGTLKQDPKATAKTRQVLLDDTELAADTLGHIGYFSALNHLADVLKIDGDNKGAKEVMSATVTCMKQRKILPAVVDDAERKTAKLK
ncbi:hypothetical protein A5320_05590 [Rheinheimera sp. SA_1]|nr:hypothetical protein A5320_05590 [Rheinheimera sp. SA_1]